MSQVKREVLSRSIAQLMPNIIQGVHIGFLAKKKLTHTQFFVLVATYSQGRPAMHTLSENMQVSMPTMTGIVTRLVKAGYVRRVQHTEDRRQVLIELTTKGNKLFDEFRQAAMARWQDVLVALNPHEIKSFQKIADKLNKSIREKSIQQK